MVSPAGAGSAAAVGLIWVAPLLAELGGGGRLSGSFWLSYPLAGLLAAARWRRQGALIAAATGLVTLLLVEGLMLDWRAFRDPDTRALLWMTALLVG